MENHKIKDVAGLIKIAERNNHSYCFFPYATLRLTSVLMLPLLFFLGFVYYFLKDFEMNLGLTLYLSVGTTFILILFFLSFHSVTILNNTITIHSLLKNKQIPIENIRNIFRYTKTEYAWSDFSAKEINTTFYLYLNNDKKIKLYCLKNHTLTMKPQPLLIQFDALINDLSNDLDLKIIKKTKNNR